MLKDFRDFAMKGNVVDLAIGVIIGAAFWQNRRFACYRRHHADYRRS